ncbi:MAG: response regulator transcription factor [Candidatus Margulisiibacteriota bacterium]|nr:response regulator transcription factor [Candidatus Margulisiibacteriota bacterium]
MIKKRILLVEDEEDIASILKLNLEADGFEVQTLYSGGNVLNETIQYKPHIILLDVMIPEKDGFEVCKELKANSVTKSVPIIFLTAKTLEHNVISGLEIGADDYITKPFSISVVISRIKAVLRRTKINDEQTNASVNNDFITAGGIQMNATKMQVKTVEGKIDLNATEFALLKYLMAKPGWVFKRTQLMEACKGDDVFVTDRSIDVLMVSIRKKLGASSHLIETVRGVGYKFKDVDA